MRTIAFDTETHLIRPGCPVPKMVCLSFAEYLSPADAAALFHPRSLPEALERESQPYAIPNAAPRAPLVPLPRLRVGLLAPRVGVRELRGWLLNPDILIVGHNLWFDFGVCIMEDPSILPLVFAKLEAGMAVDTMVRQQLLDIKDGELKFHYDEDTGEILKSSYHLADLSYRLLKRWLKKDDTWRLKYALLDGVSLLAWPEAARHYAILDSVVALDIFREQDVLAGGPIINSVEQHRAAFALGADMLGISYEEAKRRSKAGDVEIKHYRQQAKPANFGFPGGMGADAFREYSEAYGISLSPWQSQQLKDAWLSKWPEMVDYFRWIQSLTGLGAPIAQMRSGRLRGGASYCAASNGMFQGLAADGAKEALWHVARECYLGGSALAGCRPNLFIHDEIGMEVPYDAAHPEKASAAAERLSTVMVEAMKRWVPDIPIKAEPVMIRRWYKGAEIVRRADGVILPSKPVQVEKDGKKFTQWVADV